jgi:ribose 1,5-bisphosphokinase
MASGSSRPDLAVAAKIGPGRVVAIVGPSGAGKDMLIRLAREALRDDVTVVFAQRIVTRAADAAEDNIPLSPAEFTRLATQGTFAVSWSAHGLHYGYSNSIDVDISLGKTVVLNLSRMAVGAIQARYTHCHVILIDADPELRRARLLNRNRESLAAVEARIARDTPFRPANADTIIWNNADPDPAAHALAAKISGRP